MKLKVQSSQHGARHLMNYGGKMKEAPLMQLKKLTSSKKHKPLNKALESKSN